MKHRRYHEDWPTADEARAFTEQRRADCELFTKYLAWWASWFVIALFGAQLWRALV